MESIKKEIPDLYDYQEQAIEKMMESEKSRSSICGIKGYILAFEMGLGKTRTICELVKRTENVEKKPTLVVCNKSVINVWVCEINKFFGKSINYVVLFPGYCKDINIKNVEDYDIVITTYETIRKMFKQANPECFIIAKSTFSYPETTLYKRDCIPEKHVILNVSKRYEKVDCYTPAFSIKWNRIITDETQKITNYNTDISKALRVMNANFYYCLSGTPIINYDSDLYSIFCFLGLEIKKKEWNKEFYDRHNLRQRIIIETKETSNLTFPSIKYEVVTVKLSDIEKEYYNFLVKELKSAYALFQQGESTFAAPLSMFTKLRQVCACSYIIKPINNTPSNLIEYVKKKRHIKKYTKVKKCIKIIRNVIKRDEKIVIFSSFVEALKSIEIVLKRKGIRFHHFDGSIKAETRDFIIDEFNNNDKIKVFLSSYKAGGVGISLISANNVILLEPWWNDATEEQAISRVYRIGQTKPITVYSLISEQSFELYLLKIKNKKNEVYSDFIRGKPQKNSDVSIARMIINYIFRNYDEIK